jgi:hypothetical protein
MSRQARDPDVVVEPGNSGGTLGGPKEGRRGHPSEIEFVLERAEEVRAEGPGRHTRGRVDPLERHVVIEPDEDVAEVDEEGSQPDAFSGKGELAGQEVKGRGLHRCLRSLISARGCPKTKTPRPRRGVSLFLELVAYFVVVVVVDAVVVVEAMVAVAA